MRNIWGGKTTISLALALALFSAAPVFGAPSAKSLEKQAKKMESALAKFPKGALVHLHFRDGSDSNGKLGTLSENSFSFTNSDSNADETHAYSDVTKVEKSKEYIGEGTSHHHVHVF
jgi:hypothetical protein